MTIQVRADLFQPAPVIRVQIGADSFELTRDQALALKADLGLAIFSLTRAEIKVFYPQTREGFTKGGSEA